MPRSGYLLCALLVLMAVYPWIIDDFASQIVFEITSTVVAATGVYSIAASPRLRRLGAGLGLTFVVVNLGAAATMAPYLMMCGLLVALTMYAVIIVGLLDTVRRHRRITRDTLCCALSIYLMIGVFFGAYYVLISIIVPGSFAGQLTHSVLGTELNLADMLYFSFTALTTAGFGDIVPVSPQARFTAVYEEIIGVVYTTVVIARLVSLYTREED